MKFCTFCGNKIKINTKFCNHCGKELKNIGRTEHEPKLKSTGSILKTIAPSIFVGIILVGILSLVIIFLSQRSPVTINEETLMPTLSEERVTQIYQQVNEIKSIEEKRKEGYSINEKLFAEGNYTYDERTVDFRLVCTNPCPVSKFILDQEFAAIAYAISTARGLTQSDIDPSLLPFEVHASDDATCQYIPGAMAYMTSSFVDSNGYNRGLLCFFYDQINYNRDKFPYSTSIHEVMHLFESNKVPHDPGEGGSVLWEGLSEMLESFFLKGNLRDSFCWQGNAWYKQILKNSQDAHWVGGDLFFELCNEYGFDYDNLPALFDELERRNGNVDENEFVKIINNIVGADTSHLFRQAGVI